MNKTISTKYQLAPETIEKRSLNPNDGKYFQEIYDFRIFTIYKRAKLNDGIYFNWIEKYGKKLKVDFKDKNYLL